MVASKRIQEDEFCGLVLTYRVNGTLLCAPVEHVESVIEPPAITEIPQAPDYVIGAFMHRGQAALALSLRKLLRLPPTGIKTKKESVLVIRMGDQFVGYLVDEIKGMTDSGRGHWSAVPALIRDQGITRALVCDGQVYFPLDLTHSRQFTEIAHVLETYEKNKLHSVADAVVEPLLSEQETIEAQEPGTTEESLQIDLDAHSQEEETCSEQQLESSADVVSDISGIESFDTDPITTDELLLPAENLLAETGIDHSGHKVIAEDQFISADDTFVDAQQNEPLKIASDTTDARAIEQDWSAKLERLDEMPVSDPVNSADDESDPVVNSSSEQTPADAEEENQIHPSTFARQSIDTFALSKMMHAAQFVVSDVNSIHQVSEVQFDSHGQGDAFFDLISKSEIKYVPLEQLKEIDDGAMHEYFIAEGQIDAFDKAYQALLEFDALESAVVNFESEKQNNDAESGPFHDAPVFDKFHLTEEPYSFLPTSLPEDHDWLDDSIDEITTDDMTTDISDEKALPEDHQGEIDTIENAGSDIVPESTGDAPGSDELHLTEEPYSFLPTSLPEDHDWLDDSIDEMTTDISDEKALQEDRQDEIDVTVNAGSNIVPESTGDAPGLDELHLIEEPYSFLPTSLPEEHEDTDQDWLDDSIDEIIIDEMITEISGEMALPEDHQGEIDTIEDAGSDIVPESTGDAPGSDELHLIEEPYSFLPTGLPENNEEIEPYWQDESIDDVVPDELTTALMNESQWVESRQDNIDVEFSDGHEIVEVISPDNNTLNQLRLLNEPLFYMPLSLPIGDIIDVVIDSDELLETQHQPLALLPYLKDTLLESVDANDLPIKSEFELKQRPVIALPSDGQALTLPDFSGVIAKADYYTDLMVASLKASVTETKQEIKQSKNAGQSVSALLLEAKVRKPASADIYVFETPQTQIEEEPAKPPPSLGSKHKTPQLDSSGIIIRPDGQINKSYGLVKLFTIILATSAAGTWWYRDELFYKEQVRKEIPSIMQNEMAFIYSNRVSIISSQSNAEWMIVDTPDQVISVIRSSQVTTALLREHKIKGVKIYRVKKGDTLWDIVNQHLDDPYRYPELAENNRIHDPYLLRSGDVVKIMTKMTNKQAD